LCGKKHNGGAIVQRIRRSLSSFFEVRHRRHFRVGTEPGIESARGVATKPLGAEVTKFDRRAARIVA